MVDTQVPGESLGVSAVLVASVHGRWDTPCPTSAAVGPTDSGPPPAGHAMDGVSRENRRARQRLCLPIPMVHHAAAAAAGDARRAEHFCLQLLGRYMRTGTLCTQGVDVECLVDMLYMADALLIRDLATRCEEALTRYARVSHACSPMQIHRCSSAHVVTARGLCHSAAASVHH